MLFRTRRLKGLDGKPLTAKTIEHLDNKEKFFKKMAKNIDPEVTELLSEKRIMGNALRAMAKDERGIRTQAVADQLMKWQYGKKDAFDYGETRKLIKDFQKLGVTSTELKEARKNYFKELHEIRQKDADHKNSSERSVSGNHNKAHVQKTEMGKSASTERGKSLHSTLSARSILSNIQNSLRNESPPSFPHVPRRPMF